MLHIHTADDLFSLTSCH